MPRLAIIGIDSMDRDMVVKFRSSMPNMTALIKQGHLVQSMSTIPPDSVTAWATLYTGLNPAEHGMVYFADPLDKVEATVARDVDNTRLRGNTFWDDASRVGKRVCVINPHLGYPPWPVNGVMIGRSSVKEEVISWPGEAVPREELKGLNCLKGVPSRGNRGLEDAVKKAVTLLDNEQSFSVSMAESDTWDLFFVYSSVLDWIQHNFWSHHDRRDPGHVASNPFNETIRDFYERYDRFIGSLAGAVGSDTRLVVLSDHGHGLRPVRRFNFNVLLQREGLLFQHQDGSATTAFSRSTRENLRLASIRLVNEFNLGNIGLKMLEAFPRLRRSLMRPAMIDWSRSIAYVSDLSGIKAYNYGGIVIRRSHDNQVEYEHLRERIMSLIANALDQRTQSPIARLVIKREDLYQGEFIERYPDIIVLLHEDFGFGWNIGGDIIDFTETHNIQPGSHKIDSPVMLIVPGEESVQTIDNGNPGDFTMFRGMVRSLLGDDTSAQR